MKLRMGQSTIRAQYYAKSILDFLADPGAGVPPATEIKEIQKLLIEGSTEEKHVIIKFTAINESMETCKIAMDFWIMFDDAWWCGWFIVSDRDIKVQINYHGHKKVIYLKEDGEDGFECVVSEDEDAQKWFQDTFV